MGLESSSGKRVHVTLQRTWKNNAKVINLSPKNDVFLELDPHISGCQGFESYRRMMLATQWFQTPRTNHGRWTTRVTHSSYFNATFKFEISFFLPSKFNWSGYLPRPVSVIDLGSGCSRAVERNVRNQQLVGSNPRIRVMKPPSRKWKKVLNWKKTTT